MSKHGIAVESGQLESSLTENKCMVEVLVTLQHDQTLAQRVQYAKTETHREAMEERIVVSEIGVSHGLQTQTLTESRQWC
jgi:hypothetical protein